MKRGLVIGKFMPLHKGHIGLVRFAAAHCDELIVSMSWTKTDPIPGDLRFQWVKQEFRIYPKIKTEISEDTFDDESLSWPERIQRWANFLKQRFPPVDYVFSSEAYGQPLAAALGATHLSFDPDRQDFPVSASMIREHPMRYWDFIANPARSFFLKKVCFYGPESTGKSTMSQKIAQAYKTAFVPEVAREIVTSNQFTLDDIHRIAIAQNARVKEKMQEANRVLICDTDLITTGIYSRHYLGNVPPDMDILEKEITYDQYFFFDIDVPWVKDHLRDLGDQREIMKGVFLKELERRKISFIWVKGEFAQREEILRKYFDQLLDGATI